LAVAFNVSILSKDEIENKRSEGSAIAGQLWINEKEDKIFKALISLQELRKKQLIFASSEALGKILQRQPQLLAKALPALMTNEVKEQRHDIFVNVIERITREFPALLKERKILMKLTSFVNSMTGSMRGAIFKSFDRYIEICEEQDLIEISKSIEVVYDDILGDISDENQQNFLILITSIVKKDRKIGSELLDKVARRLKSLFAENKNDMSRALFYDLMVYLY